MTDITKVSSKGQVVIPNDIRKKLGLKGSDTLQIEQVGDLIVLKKVELESLSKELSRGGRK